MLEIGDLVKVVTLRLGEEHGQIGTIIDTAYNPGDDWQVNFGGGMTRSYQTNDLALLASKSAVEVLGEDYFA